MLLGKTQYLKVFFQELTDRPEESDPVCVLFSLVWYGPKQQPYRKYGRSHSNILTPLLHKPKITEISIGSLLE